MLKIGKGVRWTAVSIAARASCVRRRIWRRRGLSGEWNVGRRGVYVISLMMYLECTVNSRLRSIRDISIKVSESLSFLDR